MRLFVLDETRKPVAIGTFDEWCAWLAEHKESMTVATTDLDDGTRVLTAFLAHSTLWSNDDDNPYTFSTRILGGQFHDREVYYDSWESAEKGHHEMVAKIEKAIDPEWPMELLELEEVES